MANALAIRDLAFGFDRPDLLMVPSLTLDRGEQLLITGGSGTGKSTLLNLIAGLLDTVTGTINIAGTNIQALHGHLRDEFRGKHVGMVFQTFNLLPAFNAAENVMLAMMFSSIPPRDHKGRAIALLAQLGIEQYRKPINKLSVGQQQRVAIARAVAAQPALVLADEPTASLDPENAAAAITLLQETCRAANCALLAVSHDTAVKARFTHVVTLDELADGEPSTLPPRQKASAARGGAWQ